MRYVDRQSVPVPESLTNPDSTVARERAKAVNYYRAIPSPSESYAFKAYKTDDIVGTLESLFHKKCAYCETKYAAGQPVDVEHYRPKGAVADDGTHPGYWWLALEWKNLLPSCIDCNRERRQFIVEAGAQGLVATEKTLAGKKDAFPISTNQRARHPEDDLDLEGALLIDPTACDPNEHLEWHFQKIELPIVSPRVTDGREDDRGRCSIDVFGLNRQGLVEERGGLLLELAVEVEKIRELLEMAAETDSALTRQKIISKAMQWIRTLRRHCESNARYSALANAYIESARQQIRSQFENALLPDLECEQQG